MKTLRPWASRHLGCEEAKNKKKNRSVVKSWILQHWAQGAFPNPVPRVGVKPNLPFQEFCSPFSRVVPQVGGSFCSSHPETKHQLQGLHLCRRMIRFTLCLLATLKPQFPPPTLSNEADSQRSAWCVQAFKAAQVHMALVIKL